VRSGRALYAGISSYGPEETRRAATILRSLGTPCLIHQPSYSLFDRWIEEGLLEVLDEEGMGCIVFSPLCQGLLTDKYLRGIPEGSRATRAHSAFKAGDITPDQLQRVALLDEMARERGQKLSQMALSWVLRHPGVTSAIIGASRPGHVEDAVGALSMRTFSDAELEAIEAILK
jgi:L-glyceraldehyde 3-phosphate reductase